MARVALVSEHASPLAAIGRVDAGGQNVYVRNLAEALASRGHEVDVYTRRDDPDAPRRVAVCAGVEVVHLDAGPPIPIDKDMLFAHMDEFADGLACHLRRTEPDIVHSHFWMSGYATRQALREAATPWAHTFHALGAVKRRHQGDADTSPPERDLEERAIVQHADRIVATCADEFSELADLGADADRVAVVPCGFDASTFRPRGPGFPRGRGLRVSAVSRMIPRKGLVEMLEAVSLVHDVELVVAGGPAGGLDDTFLDQLRALASALSIESRVTFLGGVPARSVAALHRSSELFVAAPWYEPFGIAPVEAMGCGVPVVGTAVGGLLDTVVHGRTGLLVPPRDVDALAAAITRLGDDPQLRRAMGGAAVVRAHRSYPWPVIARRMEDVYARLGDRVARP